MVHLPITFLSLAFDTPALFPTDLGASTGSSTLLTSARNSDNIFSSFAADAEGVMTTLFSFAKFRALRFSSSSSLSRCAFSYRSFLSFSYASSALRKEFHKFWLFGSSSIAANGTSQLYRCTKESAQTSPKCTHGSVKSIQAQLSRTQSTVAFNPHRGQFYTLLRIPKGLADRISLHICCTPVTIQNMIIRIYANRLK